MLIADADADNVERLQSILAGRFRVQVAATGAAALAHLASHPVHVLIVGPALGDMSGVALLAAVREQDPAGEVSLLMASDEPGADNDSPDHDRVFYVLKPSVPPSDVTALVTSAAAQARGHAPHAAVATREDASRIQRILEVSRRLAVQRDLESAARVAVNAVLEFADATRAYCLFYDADSGSLWSEIENSGVEDGHATRGLAGYAARTGQPAVCHQARIDSRFDQATDDPPGRGDERILAQPVIGPDGQVHAVLIAVRTHAQPAFDDEATALLASLGELAGPLMHQLALRIEAESFLAEQASAAGGDLFRREAVAAYQTRGEQGDVVRISPGWVRWSYWVMVAMLIAGAVYLFVGTVDEYSAGPAVIRTSGRIDVTAKRAGTIMSTHIAPGQRVAKGQILARFYNADEVAELDRIETQFDLQLVKFLRNPSDEIATRALTALRTQKQRARTHLEQRVARAPDDGVVSDVRIRPGQHLAPGDIIMSLTKQASQMNVIVLLPGADRPRIRRGMTLRLEISGYRYAYQSVVIESVSDEVVGPASARRYLGAQIADSIAIRGPVVLVHARLPSRSFDADGKTYQYHDGMLGSGEVRIQSERIITALIPGLKKL